MVGMGVPMGMVNQAAFSSPNVLGMQGIMGAVPQQSLTQQQSVFKAIPFFHPRFRISSNKMVSSKVPVFSKIPELKTKELLLVSSQRCLIHTDLSMMMCFFNTGDIESVSSFPISNFSVIRGSHPRVGDKVMVEANYNPSMPFKWNAYRIQLLNAATQQEPSRPTVSQQQLPPQRGNE